MSTTSCESREQDKRNTLIMRDTIPKKGKLMDYLGSSTCAGDKIDDLSEHIAIHAINQRPSEAEMRENLRLNKGTTIPVLPWASWC